jgi:hypothetical protein
MPTQRFVKWFSTYEAGLGEMVKLFHPAWRAINGAMVASGYPLHFSQMISPRPGLTLEQAVQMALMEQALNTPKDAKHVKVSVGRKQGFQYTLNQGNRFGWKRNWMGLPCAPVFYLELLETKNPVYWDLTIIGLQDHGWVPPEAIPHAIYMFDR